MKLHMNFALRLLPLTFVGVLVFVNSALGQQFGRGTAAIYRPKVRWDARG